jgi:hypothetical protein
MDRVMTTHEARKKAVALTRLAQGGGIVLLLSAGAIAGVGLPLGQDQTPLTIELPPVPEPAEGTEPESARAADALGISRRLAAVANAPKQDQPTDTGEPVEHAAHPKPEEPVKFLGALRMPAGAMAIVEVAGKQQLARANSTLADFTIVEIEEDHIILEDDKGNSRRVEKAKPTGSLVTVAKGGRPTGAPRPNVRIKGASPAELSGDEVSPPTDEDEELSEEERAMKDAKEKEHLDRLRNANPPTPPESKPGDPE